LNNKRIFGVLALAFAAVGCRQDMHDQPKYIPLRPSDFFGDGRSERPLLPDTVARGDLKENRAFYAGMGPDNKPVDAFPIPITAATLARGRERFNIYCTPCHDYTGSGNGMIVRRGYRRPPSYHIDRLRTAPNGHFYDVISNGFGAMPDYAAQIAPADRWAIVAYVRALQFSQNAKIGDVPEDARRQLMGGGSPPATPPAPAAEHGGAK
jgi:mono/diheme cytochrome c family protein